MFAPLALLLSLMPALGTAHQSKIPAIPCRRHFDCTSALQSSGPFESCFRGSCTGLGQFALCERGFCAPFATGEACSASVECRAHWSCNGGKCVLGGLAAQCNPKLVNCMPGFACDAGSGKCVRGVAGTVCRYEHNCGFGYTCVFDKPGQGVCRLGLEGNTACNRDMHCAGPLRCFAKPAPDGGKPLRRCGRPDDLPTWPPRRSFGKCETRGGCGAGEFDCVRGKCFPRGIGQPCQVSAKGQVRECGTYATCQKGLCKRAAAGAPCRSGRSGQCEPGTRCNAPGTVPGNPGVCVVGQVGAKCADGRECKAGLLCGTSKLCKKSAEGQRCLSDFWCPTGLRCSKKTRTCTASLVPPAERFPDIKRAKPCKSTTDCGTEGIPCFNGLCLPPTLGWACTAAFNGGTVCEKGVQVAGTAGKRCSDGSGCFIGHVCDQSQSVCVISKIGDTCGRNSQCPSNSLCIRDQCRRPGRGESCEKSEQCAGKMRCVPTRGSDASDGVFLVGYCVVA